MRENYNRISQSVSTYGPAMLYDESNVGVGVLSRVDHIPPGALTNNPADIDAEDLFSVSLSWQFFGAPVLFANMRLVAVPPTHPPALLGYDWSQFKLTPGKFILLDSETLSNRQTYMMELFTEGGKAKQYVVPASWVVYLISTVPIDVAVRTQMFVIASRYRRE